jgi:hypothetical protein
MAMTLVAKLSYAEHGMQLRRAVIATTIGITIERNDFYLFSFITGLVFAKLHFGVASRRLKNAA